MVVEILCTQDVPVLKHIGYDSETMAILLQSEGPETTLGSLFLSLQSESLAQASLRGELLEEK